MKQYGDITQIHGYELEPVDLIVGGSPCQDLSIAGKRAGLDGERSGLFLEMIRVIREMREKTNGIYPRFALWENVPGAFSSNNGRDFGAVLGEFARLIEPESPDVPVPEEGWPKAGILLVSNGSIAWRTHDAQFWGVPQRRKRIALVADFRGRTAPEILFERTSVSGNIEQSEAQREDPAGAVENSFMEASGFNGWQSITSSMPILREKTPPIEATMPPNVLIVLNDQGGAQMDVTYGTAMTLRSQSHGHEPIVFDEMSVYRASSFGNYSEGAGSLRASGGDLGGGSENLVCNPMARRLTPLECERLQGYPDGWTDIPGATDSKRYKALGNSIALPFWEFLAHRFVRMGEVESIGSLFDGIGGFPLVFERAGAETKWTSEIDPFCEEVVKYHMEKSDL